jgi:hypothetical protein
MAMGLLLLLLLLNIRIVPSYSNLCNSLAMKHIPPLNETKTSEKKSRTNFVYLTSKGIDVAFCFSNKEVMLEGGSNMVLAMVATFFNVSGANNCDGVIEIIECCGFGSLQSSYCNCFERGKSHFERLKS